MGWFNIVGGAAAGAQRQAELDQQLAAKKSKTTNPLDKTVADIIKNRWLESEEARKKGITASGLSVLANAGEEGLLLEYLSDSVEYKATLDTRVTALESVADINQKGGFAVVNPKNNQIYSINSIPELLKNMGTQLPEGKIKDPRLFTTIYQARLGDLQGLSRAYGGYKNIPKNVLLDFARYAWGKLDNATDVSNLAGRWAIKSMPDGKLAELHFGQSIYGPDQQDLDPEKTKAYGDALRQYKIFSSKTDKNKLSGQAAQKAANSPNSTHVDTSNRTIDMEIPSNIEPIVSADLPQNSNNLENKDGRDDRGVEQYGTRSVRKAALDVIRTKGKGQTSLGTFAKVALNMTSEAEAVTEGVNPFAILGSMYRVHGMPKPQKQTHKLFDGTVVEHTPNEKEPDPKIRAGEVELKKKLEKSSSTISSTLGRVDDLQMVLFDMGVLAAVENAQDTNNSDDIINRLGLSVELTVELQELGRIGSDNTVTKQDLRDAFYSLRSKMKGLTPQQITMLEAEGAAALSKLPGATSTLYENIKANITGFVGLFSLKAADSISQDFLSSENGVVNQKVNSKLIKRGINFNGLIAEEREKLKAAENTMNEQRRIRGEFSSIFLQAQAAARISFQKIQLAYTYAAIAQGGEGSARTISDTDFANSILALFRAQGRGLVGVMNDIELQLKDERDAIQQIISFAGTERMSDFAAIVQNAGREVRRVRSAQQGIGRGIRGRSIKPADSATDEPEASVTPAKPADQESLQLEAEQTLRELTGVPDEKESQIITATIRDNADQTDVDVSYRIGVTENSRGRYDSSINRFQQYVAPLLLHMLNKRGYGITEAEDLNKNPRVYSALTDFILNSDDMMKSFAFLEVKEPKGLKFDTGTVNMYDILKYSADSLRQRPERDYTLTDASVMEVTKTLTKGVLTHIYRHYDKVKDRM